MDNTISVLSIRDDGKGQGLSELILPVKRNHCTQEEERSGEERSIII